MEIKTVDEILEQLRQKDAASVALIKKAYDFSKEVHKDARRYSGEPFFVHPAEVSFYLARIGMDAQTVAAGLLHDIVEDANVSKEKLRTEFGDEVLFLVDGVTKLGKIRYRGTERHAESLRKLFAATAKDIRVLIIKLLDRLHNARTLEHVPEHKRERIALETLELFAPIANRLSMGVIKVELEDAAFPYAYPKQYEQTKELLKERSSENATRMEKMERTLMRELADAHIRDFRMESRVKGVYSLYKKLERKDGDITKIHDIIALRVIVKDISDCYRILGVVHSHWRPMPGKIKDYIAFTKPNGYQSIHTTVYTGDGGTLEIQIRTEKMHSEAQYGIASHLSYKEIQSYQRGDRPGSGLEWIRNLLPNLRRKQTSPLPDFASDTQAYSTEAVPHWVKELAHVQEGSHSMQEIGADFFQHRVFVFTPQNDVIDLPLNATPIDFAYAIHSEVGNHISGAKVNGKLVSLDTALKNGDIVEIVTRPSSKPSHKWLEYAKTTMAKKHIRTALGEQEK
jgi:GTP pyrophosphokinase